MRHVVIVGIHVMGVEKERLLECVEVRIASVFTHSAAAIRHSSWKTSKSRPKPSVGLNFDGVLRTMGLAEIAAVVNPRRWSTFCSVEKWAGIPIPGLPSKCSV